MKYKHLSILEREKLQELLWQKKSIRYIASVLNRSPSSLTRELKRNNPLRKMRYTPRVANERALFKRTQRGRRDRLKSIDIREYVVSKLKLRWSPEQISGRIKIDLNVNISHEAIYQFIYHQIYRDGYGYIKPDHEDLRIYLRRKRKRRQHQYSRKSQRIFKLKGISIEERPSIVNKRKRIGDWEGDSVESKDRKPGINTLVERKTGLVMITKLKDKSSISTALAMKERFDNVPDIFKHTVTLDNGPENRDWINIERLTSLKCFYAHPYCSGERGTNENTNGLIRDYFPKKTDFDTISKEEILRVEYCLNTRPRKRLGFKTPLEVWSVALQG
jgi:transposase, IS30 family